MYNLLSKYGQVIGLGIGLFFTLIFFGMIAANGSTLDEAANMSAREGIAYLSETSIFNVGLYAVIILTILSALAMLVFGVMGIARDPKGSMRSLIGLGALAVIFLIAFMIAKGMGDGDGVMAAITKFNGLIEGENPSDAFSFITPGKSGFIGGALITTMILGGLSFLGLVVSEVMNLFR